MTGILTHGFKLDSCAVGLQLVRVNEKENRFEYYQAITFPKGPWQGINTNLRRANLQIKATGETPYVIDILDEEGDIIQDFIVSREQFTYLRTFLKIRRERETEVAK